MCLIQILSSQFLPQGLMQQVCDCVTVVRSNVVTAATLMFVSDGNVKNGHEKSRLTFQVSV